MTDIVQDILRDYWLHSAQTEPAALERLLLFSLQRCRPTEARLLLNQHPEALAGLRDLVDKFDQLAPNLSPPPPTQVLFG